MQYCFSGANSPKHSYSLTHSLTLSHRASAGRAVLPRRCHHCSSTVVAGASSGTDCVRRLNAVVETTAMDVVELKKGIAELYDESSGLWENIWGDHMHHGYYDPNADVSVSIPDHRAAQIRMIDEVLRFAGISEEPPIRIPKNLVDVGCGIGGSSRYLASKYGANAKGITLSPVQAERANALAAAQGLANQVSSSYF
ncbi:tocopherol O-methyltransferase, chloroplastic-like [Pyrus communis]|uniref:tocopherol O-methyltransferase, chloroplastic-like n=1 Tax=Pyrus communis TaxID=23211 RepID=UPI0035C0AF0E